jgi:glycosyltransferase involved in cell wall biosynthesis
MRVGIVSYDYKPPIGGLGIMVANATEALQAAHPGDVFRVFSPSLSADNGVSSLARARWGRSGGCPLFSLTLLWSMNGIIRRNALDMIHVHSGSGGVFLLRKPACPVLVTAHHTYRQEARTVYAASPLRRNWKNLMALFEAHTYRLADRITCVSADTKDELINAYGIDPSKIRVVENAIDIDRYAKLPQLQRAENTILYVGRIEPRKGVWTLIESLALLVKTNPDVRLRLAGANLLGDALPGYLKRMNIADRVSVLGRLHESMLDLELSVATVIVIPSIVEGFGLIAAQAMAAGCCVIASDCPGLRSVVTHEQTGLLFKTGDAASCAAALKRLIDEPALRTRLSAAAKADAQRRFTFELHASALYDCYTGVLTRTK